MEVTVNRRKICCMTAALLYLLLAGIPASAELTPEQTRKAQALIKPRGSRNFEVRQGELEELIQMGPDVLPLLRKTLANYLNVWLGAEEYAATQYAISSQKPLVSLLNSTIIATTATLLSVLFGSVIAYGVSRYRILSEARMFQLLMLTDKGAQKDLSH